MKDNLSTIDEGCVADGYVFATRTYRYIYVGQRSGEKPQWLKQNPEKWRRKEDVQREAASLAASVETEVNVVAASSGPNGQMSSHDVGKDGNAEDTDGSAGTIASSPPAEQASATTTLSLSEIAKNEIAIDGHMHVSTQRLASMLGISERTLSRLLRNGDRPPHVKIGGSYYYRLDKIQEWAAAKGITVEDAIG